MADFSDEAKKILEQRYLKKDKTGKVIEKPDEMLDRVATFIASNEKQPNRWKIKFLEMMDALEFLPNSPTLANAGRPLGQLSGCYVLPIEDNLSAIFEMVKQSALIHKSGGGTGFSFSKLRPKGSMVNSTFGVASGPCSFIYAFDAVTEVVKQGGMRRGANLGLLNITHPDIVEFINCKKDITKLQNFNVSVGMNGIFLDLAKNDKYHWLINPINKEDRRKIKAKEIFDLMCQNIWETGEPGMLFLDTINQTNPIPWMGRIESSNPCGEAVLLPHESCNLGSIDVSKFYLKNDLDWNRLEKSVETSVRFLDNVIDLNKFPTVKVERKTKMNRKIGLGIMGFADLLFLMKLKYDTEEALSFAEKLMKFINETAHNYSKELGREKGFFPSDNGRLKRRNACLTTIAPTGTLSILANCSSSIEPIFAKKFTKTVLGNVKMNLSEKYKDILKEKYCVSALEISLEYHIKMQATFQKHVDNAVSKTINLPKDAPVEEISKGIYLAYELGCKGLTFYRYGTRDAPIEISTESLSECDNGKCQI